MTPQQLIDKHYPYKGTCAFCGNPDARHRMFDAIKERYEAGDNVELLAWDYEFPVEFILAVIELK